MRSRCILREDILTPSEEGLAGLYIDRVFDRVGEGGALDLRGGGPVQLIAVIESTQSSTGTQPGSFTNNGTKGPLRLRHMV